MGAGSVGPRTAGKQLRRTIMTKARRMEMGAGWRQRAGAWSSQEQGLTPTWWRIPEIE